MLRKWLPVFIVVGILGIGAGIVIALTLSPLHYESAAVLEWDPATAEEGKDRARQLQTIADSVKLPKSLEKVRRALGLSPPVYKFSRKIHVRISPGSNLITIATRAPDASGAQRFAQAVVAALLDHRKTVAQEKSKERLGALRGQVLSARARLAAARQSYDEFRKKYGINDLAAERQAALLEAGTVRSETQRARAEAAAARARSRVLRATSKKMPRKVVISEQEVKPSLTKLRQLESELEAVQAGLSPDHPRAHALQAQVDVLRKRVAKNGDVVLQRTFGRNARLDQIEQGLVAASAMRRGAATRQAVFASSMKAIQRRLAKLNRVEGKSSELMVVLKAAAKQAAEREAEFQRQLLAARDPAPTLRVVDPPTIPAFPAKTYRRFIAAVTPIAVFFLVAVAFFMRTFWGLRVHTAKELAFWGKAPVVASTTWPSDPGALGPLVEELHEPLCRAALRSYLTEQSLFEPGCPTLLLPAGAEEARIAQTLASQFTAPALMAADGGSLRGDGSIAIVEKDSYSLELWTGPLGGPELRLAARKAERVLVLVGSGRHSILRIAGIPAKLGRQDGFAFLLTHVGTNLADLESQVGDAQGFWRGSVQTSVS